MNFRARAIRKISLAGLVLLLGLARCASTGWIDPQYSENPVTRADEDPAEEDLSEPQQPEDKYTLATKDVQLGDTVRTTPEKRTTLPPAAEKKKPARSAGAVRYTGNRFVREVRKINGKDTVVMSIRGNAALRQGSNTFTGNILEVFGEDSAYAKATGNLRLTDPASGTVLNAKVGEYFRDAEMVKASGNPRILHTNKKNKRVTNVTSVVMERFLATAVTYCRGNVKVVSDEFIGFADLAEYNEQNDTITLTGNPRVFQKNNIVIADTIILENANDLARLRENVAIFYTEEPEKPEADKGVVSSIVKADYGLYEFSEKTYLGRKITLTAKPENRVTLNRPDVIAKSDKTEIWGEQGEELYATGNVYMKREGEQNLVRGDNLRYWKILGRAVMTKETSYPQIISYDENGKEKINIRGEKIERNFFIRKITVKGDVQVRTSDSNSTENGEAVNSQEDMVAYGEWAELEEDKKLMIIYGNPRLVSESGNLRAREIWLFPEEGRYELQGGIHGEFLSK
ncbi:MAG: hypothetical protein KDK41_02300 [Leptospiraceae bacterium]|nr:hypothetical protein [Leptospiraceae bacterium]